MADKKARVNDRLPPTVDRVPSTVDRVPSTVDRVPSTVDRVPSTVDRLPSPVDRTPSTVDRPPSPDLLLGTLDTLVLKTLSWGPRHGYAVARWIRDTSDGTILVEDRALYVALHRLEERGWVEASWGLSENNRKARYYSLTSAGRQQLGQKAADFTTYANAVFKILRTVEEIG